MSGISFIADNIPGFLAVALIFKGTTPSGNQASIIWLKDADNEAVVELSNGLHMDNPQLTLKMRSYLSGMAEVGDYLKARKKDDESDVTENDIERAALTLAFPRIARNETAFGLLKSHLDALQKHGVIDTLTFASRGGQNAASMHVQNAPPMQPGQTGRPDVRAPASTTPGVSPTATEVTTNAVEDRRVYVNHSTSTEPRSDS